MSSFVKGFVAASLALSCLATACTSTADQALPDPPHSPTEAPTESATSSPTEPEQASPTEAAQEQSTPNEGLAVPAWVEVRTVDSVDRTRPAGVSAERLLVAVGATPSDPRFVELTLFEFDQPADAAAAATSANPETLQYADDPVALESGVAFGFLEATGATNRGDLELLTWGPAVDSTVRGTVGSDRVLVGAARVVQSHDVNDIVTAFLDGPLGSSDSLSVSGMSVLIDAPLGDGLVAEMDSLDGAVRVEIYDDAAPGWLEYAARDALGDLVPPLDLGLAGNYVIQGPSKYAMNGKPIDPSRLFWWDDGRLTIISYPPTIGNEALAELAGESRRWTSDDLAALLQQPGQDSAPAPTPEPPAADTRERSVAPSAATMRELQQFAEDARGVEAGQPLHFDFVDRIPTLGMEGFFVSNELWLIMSALGLVDDDHTREGADQARIDRVRGTPGVVALQPTAAETNLVVVHEIVHILDEQLGSVSSASPELLDPVQALLEGNAHRVTYSYVESLPPEERAMTPGFPGIFPTEGDPRLTPAMQDVLEFAYDEGRIFVTALTDSSGEAAVIEAFQRPPTTTEHILFPDSYLADDQPVLMSPPDPPAGAETVAEGVLGAYLLAIAAHDGAAPAVDLVRGWAGDAYGLHRTGGQICLRASIRMDTDEAAQALADGLDAATREVVVNGSDIELTACTR